ncbi:MAG: hypothetical protein GXX78_03735 [Bacteroidales bacterium]|nr:hypothetical protein [Bacteroidales bacterium]
MKKIFTLFVFSLLVTFTFSQNKNSTGGTNYYDAAGLVGQVLPALSAPTGNALVFVDESHSNDGVVSSLTNNGYAVTVASDWYDFNLKIANGQFQLAVAFAQNYSAVSDGLSTTGLKNFIDNGGSVMFATWTAFDASVVTIMEAAFTGNNNLSTVTITDAALANGLTNPFSLSNPGWGIYSMGLSAIGGGEVVAVFENGDAAMVRGNNGHTMMIGYLSDAPNNSTEVRESIIANIVTAANVTVPISYWWIILAFVVIAGSVVFTKRKVIFG